MEFQCFSERFAQRATRRGHSAIRAEQQAEALRLLRERGEGDKPLCVRCRHKLAGDVFHPVEPETRAGIGDQAGGFAEGVLVAVDERLRGFGQHLGEQLREAAQQVDVLADEPPGFMAGRCRGRGAAVSRDDNSGAAQLVDQGGRRGPGQRRAQRVVQRIGRRD